MSSLVNIVGKVDFETQVLKSELPVLVDFWAPWCGPCQMMTPILEELAKDYEGKMKIVKVDTDQPDNQGLATDYAIQSIPNLKLFKAGAVVKEIVGYKPKEGLIGELKELV
jgi:thioredoxin 1